MLNILVTFSMEKISWFIHFSLDQQHGGQEVGSTSQWCGAGAFPSDLEDVTLSPTNNLKGATSNPNGGCFEANSSSCSPPSVTDLTPLNPQDHFDPDFDVVDDMKFIDSLIRTMPEDHQSHQQHHGSDAALANSYHANSNKR